MSGLSSLLSRNFGAVRNWTRQTVVRAPAALYIRRIDGRIGAAGVLPISSASTTHRRPFSHSFRHPRWTGSVPARAFSAQPQTAGQSVGPETSQQPKNEKTQPQVPEFSCDGECWKCEIAQPIQLDMKCGKCGTVQRITDSPDLFALFQIPCRVQVDTECIKDRYRDLARRSHPDGFATSSTQEQEVAEHNSSVISTAYSRLLDPVSRSVYVMESRYGVPFNEESQTSDLEFLTEVMEVREQVEELVAARDWGRLTQITEDYQKRMQTCLTEIDSLLDRQKPMEAHEQIVRLRYFQTIVSTCEEALPSK